MAELIVSFFFTSIFIILIIMEIFSRSKISIFYFFALVYIVIFYALPLFYLSFFDEYFYLNRHYENINNKAWYLWAYLLIFTLGLYTIRFFPNNHKLILTENKYSVIAKPIMISSVMYLITLTGYLFITEYAANSAAYRSGALQLNKFIAVAVISAVPVGVFTMSIFLSENINKIIIFIISLFVIYISFTISGRVYFFVSIVLSCLIFTKNMKFLILSALMCLFIFLPYILNLKILLTSLQEGGDWGNFFAAVSVTNVSDLYLQNFGFLIFSGLSIDKLIEVTGYRYFYDYLHGFLFYLRAFGIDTGDSLTYYNTYVLLDKQKSIIPPGYIVFGYVQFNVLGVFLSGVFFGLLGRLANFVSSMTHGRNQILEFYLFFLAANTFYYGEIRTIVLNFFLQLIIIYFLLLMYYRRKRIHNNNKT